MKYYRPHEASLMAQAELMGRTLERAWNMPCARCGLAYSQHLHDDTGHAWYELSEDFPDQEKN
jgi:hypothetical protein